MKFSGASFGVCLWFFGRLADAEQVVAPSPSDSSAETSSIGAPAPQPTKQAASAAFAQAVRLAEGGRYAEAKALFLEAYGLVPHPIVAYNAALACIALGEREEAAELLDRALAASEDQITAGERAAILSVRNGLVETTTPPPPGTTAPSALPEPRRAGPSVPLPAPALQAPRVPVRASFGRVPNPEPPPSDDRGSSNTLGYVFGAAGAALLLGSGALYLWNDGRHETWARNNAALEEERDSLLAESRTPSEDPALRDRARENDQRWDSIRRVDVLSVTLLSAGAVALGIGTYLTLTQRRVDFGLTHRSVELAYRF